MSGAARVLIVGLSETPDSELTDLLSSEGFETSRISIRGCSNELTGNRRPDIVLLDLQSDEAHSDLIAFLTLARSLKKSALGSRMRVMIVGSAQGIKLDGALEGVDDLLIGPINAAQIAHRLRSLVRLNTMHEELVRRLNTSARYGADAPEIAAPPQIENPTILVLGHAVDLGPIEHALSQCATLVGALTVPTALDYLSRQAFDAIIINYSSDLGRRLEAAVPELEHYLGFTRDLRRNSQLYNIPVLLLSDPDCLADADEIYDAGITDIVAKPFESSELVVRVDRLVRELRFRDSLKTVYGQAKHFVTSDSLTGLYSRGFLLEHLATVIGDAEHTSQSFSVAGFSVSNITDVNEALGYAGGDRVIRQVGEVISLLVRGEDLPARYSGSRFALLLPDTSVEAAAYAVNRIRGVVAHTEFAIEGVDCPVHISLSTRIAGYEAGDDADGMLARLWTQEPLAAAAAA